jgi:hypothetical protein
MKSFKKHLDEKYNTCPSCKGSGVHHVGKDHDGVSKEFECSHCDGRGKTKVGVREDIEQVDESGSEESVKIEETTFKRNPHPPTRRHKRPRSPARRKVKVPFTAVRRMLRRHPTSYAEQGMNDLALAGKRLG